MSAKTTFLKVKKHSIRQPSTLHGNAWPKYNATKFHTQLGLPDKDRAMEELVVSNSWNVRSMGPTIKVWLYVVINRPKGF